MISRVTPLALGALAMAMVSGACSSPSTSDHDQVVSGRVALSSFPAAVTSVRVMQGNQKVTEQQLGSDGSFSLALPQGTNYRIEFAAGVGSPTLVFPRRSGSVDSTFTVAAGGAAFDLGMIRYIGNPSNHNYSYGPGTDNDGECEDGVDPTTGDVCVDDDDDEGASCEGNDGDAETNDDGDAETNDDGDAETDDGDTETDDDGDTEADDDGDTETDDDGGAPGDAAVADHNLPNSVGCGAETDDDDVQCEDGIDATTGLPCDDNEGEDGDSAE